MDATTLESFASVVRPLLRRAGASFGLPDGIFGVLLTSNDRENDVFFAEFTGTITAEDSGGETQYELPSFNLLSSSLRKVDHPEYVDLASKDVSGKRAPSEISAPLRTLFDTTFPDTIRAWRAFLNLGDDGETILYFIPRDQRESSAWKQLLPASFLIAECVRSTMTIEILKKNPNSNDIDQLRRCLPKPLLDHDDFVDELRGNLVSNRDPLKVVKVKLDFDHSKKHVKVTLEWEDRPDKVKTVVALRPQRDWLLHGASGLTLLQANGISSSHDRLKHQVLLYFVLRSYSSTLAGGKSIQSTSLRHVTSFLFSNDEASQRFALLDDEATQDWKRREDAARQRVVRTGEWLADKFDLALPPLIIRNKNCHFRLAVDATDAFKKCHQDNKLVASLLASCTDFETQNVADD